MKMCLRTLRFHYVEHFNVAVEETTVTTRYDVEAKPAEGYQSEAALEQAFISQLVSQGYDYAREQQYEYYRNKLLTFE